MEVRNSIGEARYYGPSDGGPSKKKKEGEEGDGEDELASVMTQVPSMPFGDSMIVSARATPRRDAPSKQSVEPDVLFHWLGIARLVALGVCFLALLALLLMAIQPLLAIIFSLGACLVGSCSEWMDFTFAIFRACSIPATIIGLGFLVSIAISIKMKALAEALPEDANDLDPLYCLARKASKKSK